MLEELRLCALGPYLSVFVTQLIDCGYARETIRIHLRIVRNFARWLRRKRIELRDISDEHIQHYVRYRFRKAEWTRYLGIKAALTRLLNILKQNGLLRRGRSRSTGIQRVMKNYADYLREQRNLTDSTIARHRLVVSDFVSELFKRGLKFSKLKPEHLMDFVRRSAGARPKSSKCVTTALRSFLRYLRYEDLVKVDLADAVPSVARWSLTAIPRAISRADVRSVLADCDRRTATGRRDYAILLMLARLGVRGCEIRWLKLEDIDWEAGRISIHGKNGHLIQLPLLTDVGEALVEYITDGRPRTQCRYVFLRTRGPIGPLKSASTVSNLVGRALARAGVDSPTKGTHQFRHGLATEMLRQGASLCEIGELLGHRKADTTAIYAKVDIVALRSLALPWPGGVR
jgi:site-specific recombinase XerD